MLPPLFLANRHESVQNNSWVGDSYEATHKTSLLPPNIEPHGIRHVNLRNNHFPTRRKNRSVSARLLDTSTWHGWVSFAAHASSLHF